MPVPKLPGQITACLFDLDGVLTQTASVHARAWKEMFDAFLKERAGREGTPFQPFEIATDYTAYVDGRLREDGVRTFLASRHITLPEGSPDDGADADTVNGLATRKNDLFHTVLERDGVTVYQDAVRFVEIVRDAGLRRAVVSASKNTADILERAGLTDLFEARIDGVVAAERGLPGKPAPDTYLAGAKALATDPAHCVVFEDAISGVQAGRAGNFGYVVGVDRVGQAEALKENGADVVVSDLSELLVTP